MHVAAAMGELPAIITSDGPGADDADAKLTG
jgi:hypothetical protein